MRVDFRAAFCAVMLCTISFAAELPPETMPTVMARKVADRTVELVESRGLYPRQQAEYDQAKVALLATFDGQPVQIDRSDLYARIRQLLRTLDTNGHSFLIPVGRQSTAPRKPAAPDGLLPPTFELIKTSKGMVLRWTPPPIVGSGPDVIPAYLKRFHDEAAAKPDIAHACALVVDLSEQTGGNAWPPFVAMYPLFGEANKANWVDRDGKREAFVNRTNLETMNRTLGDGRANPLRRFGSGPLAVVVGKRTSSAGEMLLVALLGEARVQTFGDTSSGMTTANVTYPLADGSSLVLTQSRYALGDGPVYRGGIAPMHQMGTGEILQNGVTAAAQWAAENSPGCGAAALNPRSSPAVAAP